MTGRRSPGSPGPRHKRAGPAERAVRWLRKWLPLRTMPCGGRDRSGPLRAVRAAPVVTGLVLTAWQWRTLGQAVADAIRALDPPASCPGCAWSAFESCRAHSAARARGDAYRTLAAALGLAGGAR